MLQLSLLLLLQKGLHRYDGKNAYLRRAGEFVQILECNCIYLNYLYFLVSFNFLNFVFVFDSNCYNVRVNASAALVKLEGLVFTY